MGHERLSEYLASRRLSAADLCRRTGINDGVMSRYLSGQRTPGVTVAVLLERATGGAVPVSSWAKTGRRKNGHARKVASTD